MLLIFEDISLPLQKSVYEGENFSQVPSFETLFILLSLKSLGELPLKCII